MNKNTNNKISTKANLAYNMVYQVLILIIPLIVTPYVSRAIGANGVGTFSYYDSIALYFVYFSMLGVLNYGNRCIAANRNSRDKTNIIFSEIYAMQIIECLVVALIYLVFIRFIARDKLIAFILLTHVLSSIFDVSWLFYGLEEFKITSIRQIVIRILSMLAVFALVKTRSDLWKYCLIMGSSYLLSTLSLWVMTWSRVKWVKPDIKNVFSHFKPLIILFIPIIATSIYRQMDKIMIGIFSNMNQVGYYESADKLINISLGLISSFSNVIMPKISNLRAKGDRSEIKRLFDLSMKYAICIGFGIAFGIAAVSNEFVPLFFGSEYIPSISIAKALCITVPFISWACIVRTLYLIPYEEDGIYVISIVIGAILNLIFNAIFIPKYQAIGAVIGSIVAEISVAAIQSIKCRKEIETSKYLKVCIPFAVFGMVMYFIVRIVALISIEAIWKIAMEIIIGVIVYLLMTLIYFKKNNDPVLKDAIKTIKSKSNL